MHRVCLLVLASALVVAPALADAQRRPAPRRTTRVIVERDDRRRDDGAWRQMTLGVGMFRYDVGEADNHPMAALRADWRLRHWLRSEVSLAYAFADLEGDDAAPDGDDDANSHLLAATVGLNAEAPWPIVRPYVGMAVGLFSRLDDEEDGDFVRPTLAVPVGVRLPLSSRLALRGEVRWRFDEHPDGASVVNREHTIGLSFAY